MSKITRAIIKPLFNKPPKLGEFLVIDMWGLTPVLLLQKNLYFITFKCKGFKYKFIEFTQDQKSYFEKMIKKIAFIET